MSLASVLVPVIWKEFVRLWGVPDMSVRSGRYCSAAVAGAVSIGVGLLVFAFRFFSDRGFSNDHFVHLARAQQMLLGGWPVRDFVDPGMPLMYVASALGLSLGGHNLLAESLIVYTALGAAAALSVWLAWRVGSPLIAAVTAVGLQVLLYPRAYNYPKLIVYAIALLACWHLLYKPSRVRAIMLGSVVVMAFLFRHDHGIFVGVAAMLTVGLTRLPANERLRMGLVVVGTSAVLIAPWAAYVSSVSGLGDYVRSAIEFSRQEAVQTRLAWPSFRIDRRQPLWNPVPTPPGPIVHVRWTADLTDAEIVSREGALGLERVAHHEGRTWRYHLDADRIDGLLANSAVEDTEGLDRLRPPWWQRTLSSVSRLRGSPGPGALLQENSEAFLFYLFILVPMGMLLGMLRTPTLFAWTDNSRAMLAVVSVLALLVDFGFLRDPLDARLPDASLPSTMLWACMLGWAYRRPGAAGQSRHSWKMAATAVILVLTVVSVTTVGETRDHTNRIGALSPATLTLRSGEIVRGLRDDPNEFFMPSRVSRQLVPVYDYLQECTNSNDRWMYYGFAPEVYFFASRGFAGGQVVFLGEYYSSVIEQERIRDRLMKESVPLVIVPVDEADDFRSLFPIVYDHIATYYHQIGQIVIDTEDDDLIGDRFADVYVDGRLPTTRNYDPLGWPCFT